MKTLSLYVVVLAAGLTLTSVAAGAPDAAKTRVGVVITTKGATLDWNTSGRGKFVLTPLKAGVLKRDSGTVTTVVNNGFAEGKVVVDQFESFKGKRGSLEIRSTITWVDAGNGYHRGSGTWKVMGHGTGQYAKVTGRGMRKDVWREGGRGPWSARRMGLLTRASVVVVP
jgi:hypothetical protein